MDGLMILAAILTLTALAVIVAIHGIRAKRRNQPIQYPWGKTRL